MKKDPIFIGFLQALGVTGYVVLISTVLLLLTEIGGPDSPFLALMLILLLLVFSAAITGAIVFVYPLLLAIKKDTRSALAVLGSTLAWLLPVIIIFTTFIFI